MTAKRAQSQRGQRISFTFRGNMMYGYEGETLAAALLAANVPTFNQFNLTEFRQPFCNMGTCFDCVLRVEGKPLVRSCLVDLCEGMVVDIEKDR